MRTPLQRIRIGGFVLGTVFVTGVVGYHFLGDYDWSDAVWMVVITISTVGFSEHSQLPTSIQALTIAVIVFGISASVYTSSGLFQMILEGELENILGKRRMTREIQNLSNHTVICGFGRMGRNLVNELTPLQKGIVVIDNDAEAVADADEKGLLCIQGDATNENVLEAAGIQRASCLVSTFPNDAESVFITLTARDLNPDIRIIARAERDSTERKLRQAGADMVVMPTLVGARQMERMITRPSTAHLINLVGEGKNRVFDLDELEVKPDSQLIGMNVQQTEAHRRHKLLVLAIKKPDGELRFNPDVSDTFAVGDVILLIGHGDDIARFRAEFSAV